MPADQQRKRGITILATGQVTLITRKQVGQLLCSENREGYIWCPRGLFGCLGTLLASLIVNEQMQQFWPEECPVTSG